MSAVRSFLKRDPVLILAALAAAVSCFFVPPDREYIRYIDFRTLALLYSLMTVVAGLRQAGLFAHLAHVLCEKVSGTRAMGTVLVLLCFFSAMFITNDVALLTFVPFAVVVLTVTGQGKALIRVVVLQAVAANLGSMLTPVGNPQNLFLFSYYNMAMADFFRITLPVWLLSLALLLLCCLTLPRTSAGVFLGEEPGIRKKELWLHLALFAVCLLSVVRVLPWGVMLGIVVAALLFFDRKLLRKADYLLLLTFVAFFLFAGNLARVESVDVFLRRILAGREYLTSLLTSQVISNVPAALLLSGFTPEAKELLLGVNVGGLGTPIASLASLIALKLYSHSDHARPGRFLGEFTVVNLALLLILSLARHLF